MFDKRALMSAMVLCFASSVFANGYGGLNFGGNTVLTQKLLSYPVSSAREKTAQYDASSRGFHGQLTLGWAFPFNERIAFAVDGNFDYRSGWSQYSIEPFFLSENALAREQLANGFSLFLLTRYALTPESTLFLGPGLTTAQFKVQSKEATAGNVGVTTNQTSWVNGWGLKAGADLYLRASVSLRLTYQYLNLRQVHFTAVEPLTESPVSGEYTPANHSVLIGLIYHL